MRDLHKRKRPGTAAMVRRQPATQALRGVNRHWPNPICERQDVLTVKPPVNNPFHIYGYCMVWKYTLNGHGYGVLNR